MFGRNRMLLVAPAGVQPLCLKINAMRYLVQLARRHRQLLSAEIKSPKGHPLGAAAARLGATGPIVPFCAGVNVSCRSQWSIPPVGASLTVMTAKKCKHRADEAKILAIQTQDLWERETLLHIATLWQLVGAHRAGKEATQTN